MTDTQELAPAPQITPEFDVPEALSIEQIASFIGNTEKKCVIQLLVKPDETVSAATLNERFAQAQDPPNTIRYRSLNNLAQTVTNSHKQAHTLDASDSIRYSEWDAHKPNDSEMADSIAGHNLWISSEYGVALELLFGKTSTVKDSVRSPEVRLHVFDFLSGLSTDQHLTLPELATHLDLKPNLVQSHISALHEHGFLEYETTPIAKQEALFEITANIDPHQHSLTRRGKRVRQQENYAGDLTIRTQLGQIVSRFQKSGISTFSYQQILEEFGDPASANLETISGELSLMAREGIVKRLHKTANKDQFSKIYLEPAQKAIIDNVASVYRGLSEKDPHTISEGIRLGALIMSEPQLVTELLEKSFNHSSSVNRRPFTDRVADIGRILAENPELSTRQIKQHYEEGRLTLSGVSTVLRRMRNSGVVQSRQAGTEKLWRLVS